MTNGGLEGTALTVDTVGTPHGEAWDRFVERFDGTFCHLSAWAGLLGDVMGAEPRFRVATDGEGRWVGVLPLFRVRSRLFGHYLVSVPYLNYGGPLGEPEARRALVADAAAEARASEVDLMELRLRDPLDDPPQEVRYTDRKITVVLNLPDDPDVLFKDVFRAKLRNQVRRPMKEGMKAHFGPDQVDDFLEVFQRNMRDLGTPVLPSTLFRRLPDVLGERVTFGVIRYEGRPVAAGCGFTMGGELEMTWASSLLEYNRKAPNMLLYWAFMERAIEQGVSTFNFGRCTPGGGTHRFKKQWGSEDQALPWLQWSAEDVDATPTPDSGKYDLAIRLWRKLPVTVANRIGPFIARKIP